MSNRHQNKRKKEREAKRVQLLTALQNRRETALMLNYQPVNCPDDVWEMRAVRCTCH